jgi:quinol monooxygenase YgiN
MTVTAIIHVRAKPGLGGELRDTLIAFIPHAREDAQCKGIDILVDAENSDHIVLIEEWSSIDAHITYYETWKKREGYATIAKLRTAPGESRHYEVLD